MGIELDLLSKMFFTPKQSDHTLKENGLTDRQDVFNCSRSSHLALQGVSPLSCLHLHVIRQWGVLVQSQPVVLVTDQWLGLLGVGHLHHVHGEVELRQLLGRVLLVLHLEMDGDSLGWICLRWIVCFRISVVVFLAGDLHRSAACWHGQSERCWCHPEAPSARSSCLWSSRNLLCTFAAKTNQSFEEYAARLHFLYLIT